MARLTILALLVASAAALKPRSSHKGLVVRGGGGMLTKSTYAKTVSGVFAAYGVQMLLMPKKMHEDHFETPSSTMTEFWIRGHAATIAAASYALFALPAEIGHKVAWAWTAGIALLYPYNAKFSALSSYAPKYPMHYVPEVLMGTFLVLGALAK